MRADSGKMGTVWERAERADMMNGYVWLHHGKEQSDLPEEIIKYAGGDGRKAVCICGLKLAEELQKREPVIQIPMEQLLLDERYVEYGLVLEKETLRLAGGVNQRLLAKREYELALRVAQIETIYVVFTDLHKQYEDVSFSDYFRTASNCTVQSMSGFCTDAYVAGRYYSLLKKLGLAESVMEGLIGECGQQAEPDQAQSFLEDMVSHSAAYQRIYRATQPVLIYLGPSYCYNILNVFAKELGHALEQLGCMAEYYDTEHEDVGEIGRLLGRQYRASIGFQTWMMSVKHDGGKRMLQDLIGGPKFNFIVDHPVWLDGQLKETPERFHVLTHDRNYIRFIHENYPNVPGVHLLPPGGRDTGEPDQRRERGYDIIFLGTYRNYRNRLSEIRTYPDKKKFLALRFLGIMKKRTALTPEQALKEAMEYYGMQCGPAEFRGLLFESGLIIQLVMYYYREKVIRTILDGGLHIHVYGDSWADSPFSDHPGLLRHPEIPAGESTGLLRDAKISLNIMAWHKDGFTERVADSMLAGAVVVSDYSTQLAEFYGDETVLFDLEHLEQLPGILKGLLADQERRTGIAGRAREKALRHATWEKRARELMRLIEKEGNP